MISIFILVVVLFTLFAVGACYNAGRDYDHTYTPAELMLDPSEAEHDPDDSVDLDTLLDSPPRFPTAKPFHHETNQKGKSDP